MLAATSKRKRSAIHRRPAAAPAKKPKKADHANAADDVDIKEICSPKLAKSISQGAFLRRGYDIGVRHAQAIGFDKTSQAATDLGRVGYAKARGYLSSLRT